MMDDHEDPISQFFPDTENVDLYEVLGLASDAKPDEIKKAYRRLALVHHPDKHATADDAAKADASLKFQQIGFAYAVLGDEKRRQRYDRTGKTDEDFELGPGEDGWEAYFEQLFDKVTREKLDEMKKEYQGSAEEVEDLKKAYTETGGAIGEIMKHVPHSTHDDEARFIIIISSLIEKGELESLDAWTSSIKDEKAKLVRKKQSDREAKEAERLAKELGIWDEFYGSGKAGPRKGKEKAKGKEKEETEEGAEEEEEDHSALKALMMKRKKNMDGFFDSLAAKYADADKPKGKKGKKRGKAAADDEDEGSPKKKSKRGASPPPIDNEEFEQLQQKLFGEKAKSSGAGSAKPSSKGKGTKTRAAAGKKAR
ncbi:DnaJ-domain-containing protein [Obba rivulosa]|uniref:DnaJ-domain-containing protein n=1 Tax=Obba rivulosa TaxID=1052685 RepID=A0A8E2DTY7_9APHY|nr:DnaJ-domain-containing protein [Obba rivulosa]